MYASVELHAESETVILPAGNISLGGCYLAADGHDLGMFEVGSHVEVAVFDALNEKKKPVTLDAEVMRVDEDGMALMWSATDSDAAIRLAKLLDSLKVKPKKERHEGGETEG
ncbi:MAG: hypothetical protein JWN44_1052 [Myxococcales bacterium]|nr:hypothetical protein [Myxococcales bacterium]